MSDSLVTVAGRLTDDPVMGYTKNNKDVFATFDVAVNHGCDDRERGQWLETGASFYSVSTFRNLALNVLESLQKATPVVVQGKLRLTKWQNGDRQGTTARIEASAIGPDLAFGQADFTVVKRPLLSNADPMEDEHVRDAAMSEDSSDHSNDRPADHSSDRPADHSSDSPAEHTGEEDEVGRPEPVSYLSEGDPDVPVDEDEDEDEDHEALSA